MTERCPTCGAKVETIFAHVDGCPPEKPAAGEGPRPIEHQIVVEELERLRRRHGVGPEMRALERVGRVEPSRPTF